MGRQRIGQRIAIVLRIGARARNGAHVDDYFDAGALQQIDELGDGAGRMPDREERMSHAPSATRPGARGFRRCCAAAGAVLCDTSVAVQKSASVLPQSDMRASEPKPHWIQ